MDPLSIGSAVIGIISASIRIGKPLYDLIHSLHEAPASASALQTELRDITSALEQLQRYLIGVERTTIARRSMLSLTEIVATLTGCVTTYSEVERLVVKCTTEGEITGKIESAKWVFYERDIEKVVARLQSHKLSLVFMLNILQCESQQEAEKSMRQLIELVGAVLESNADLRTRLDILAADHDGSLGAATSRLSRQEAPLHARSASFSGMSYQPFEEDLNSSRVYRRAKDRPTSLYSLRSSERHSLAMSAFSDLSLSNVSMISVLCLPVWSADLVNARYFRFGQAGLELTTRELKQRYPEIDLRLDTVEEEDKEQEQKQEQQYNNTPWHPGHAPLILSTVPTSDTHAITSDEPASNASHDPDELLFRAISDSEFRYSAPRTKGGHPYPRLVRGRGGIPYPYLEYAPRQLFEVIDIKRKLWLARNANDQNRTVGWIWSKHFVRVLEARVNATSHIRFDPLWTVDS